MAFGAQLTAYVVRNSDRDFEYDGLNCGSFVCNWVEIRTGIKIDFPTSFPDMKAALKFLKSHGGYAHAIDAVCNEMGFRFTNKPTTGDVTLMKDDVFGCIMGIYLNEHHSVFAQEEGLVTIANEENFKFIDLCPQ